MRVTGLSAALVALHRFLNCPANKPIHALALLLGVGFYFVLFSLGDGKFQPVIIIFHIFVNGFLLRF